jgi:hypothetical protein
MTATALAARGGDTGAPALDLRLQQVVVVLVVAAAVKTPLGVPLYLNALLLLLGLATLLIVQSVQSHFVWILALIGVGGVTALAGGTLATSGPRLAQLFLILLATSLISRLEPELLGRHLALLLPAMLLVTLTEVLLPEPLFHFRNLFGQQIYRQGGLHGEPNYSAVLYGVVAVILAQYRPRVLAILPLLLAVPFLSRGLWLAVLVWLGAELLRRIHPRLVLAGIMLVCLQPFLVLLVDGQLTEATRAAWVEASNGRFGLWLAYGEMGLSHPLGVGYFQGAGVLPQFAEYLPVGYPLRYAHSLFLQVFGEFGWLGYLLFLGFLGHVGLRALRFAPAQLPLLAFLVTGYGLVNGLSDWAFWVPIGYVLAQARIGASEKVRGSAIEDVQSGAIEQARIAEANR